MFLHLSVIHSVHRGEGSLSGRLPPPYFEERAVRILLECILVIIINLDFAGAAAAVKPTLDDTVVSLEASSNDSVSCQIYF